MTDLKVARRYAKSLLDLAREKGSLDAVSADMKEFISVCDHNRDLGLLLANPIISSDKKLSVLKSLFEKKMNNLSVSFFEIVTRKGREKFLIDIAKQFVGQYKIYKGIQTAEITSAVGLDDKLRASVYKILRENTRSEIELVEKVDKKLVGGFVIRIGDKQFDSSISSELRRLTQAFSSNPYLGKN